MFDGPSLRPSFKTVLWKFGLICYSHLEAIKLYPEFVKIYIGSIIPLYVFTTLNFMVLGLVHFIV